MLFRFIEGVMKLFYISTFENLKESDAGSVVIELNWWRSVVLTVLRLRTSSSVLKTFRTSSCRFLNPLLRAQQDICNQEHIHLRIVDLDLRK